jgi:hypothetical protein
MVYPLHTRGCDEDSVGTVRSRYSSRNTKADS